MKETKQKAGWRGQCFLGKADFADPATIYESNFSSGREAELAAASFILRASGALGPCQYP